MVAHARWVPSRELRASEVRVRRERRAPESGRGSLVSGLAKHRRAECRHGRLGSGERRAGSGILGFAEAEGGDEEDRDYRNGEGAHRRRGRQRGPVTSRHS